MRCFLLQQLLKSMNMIDEVMVVMDARVLIDTVVMVNGKC